METILALISGGISILMAIALIWAVHNNSQFRTNVADSYEKTVSLLENDKVNALNILKLTNEKAQLTDQLAAQLKLTDAERRSRTVVEEQRDELLKALEAHGDTDGLATSINAELERLRQLAKTGGDVH